MYRAVKEDIPELKALWKEVFKDTDSYINLYFKEKFEPEKTFVYRMNDEITSALYFSDVTLHFKDQEYKTAYICGISTKKSARKKGQAPLLINECLKELEASGYDIAFLIPANESLISFYERFGFEIFSTLKYSQYEPDFLRNAKTVTDCNCDKFYNKLQALKPKRTEHDFDVLKDCYGSPFCFEDGYMYTSYEKGVFHVFEHNYNDEKALTEKINSIIPYDTKLIKVKSPSWFNFGEERPFSMYYNFKNISFLDNKYINLLLN